MFSGAEGMDNVTEHLLAYPTLSYYQHRQVGTGHLHSRIQGKIQCRRIANNSKPIFYTL